MYKITKEMINIATEFAEKSAITSIDKYSKRNQSNLDKIKIQIKDGKIGEMIIYEHLSQKFPEISKPDLSIFDKSKKNWNADLKDTLIPLNISCKTQNISSEIAYGSSWVFQYRTGAKYDCDTSIFGEKDDHHYVAFASINTPKCIGKIRAIVKVQWLHNNNLFKPMKLKNLQNNKMAIYYEDLEKYTNNELWQL